MSFSYIYIYIWKRHLSSLLFTWLSYVKQTCLWYQFDWYVCVWFLVCIFGNKFSSIKPWVLEDIYIYMTEHNRHFLSTYFFVNPFELPYWSYDIRWELVDKSSIISYFPSTFYPNLGHHQGRMYYKRYITFVCTLLLRKKSVCTVILF